MDAHGIKSGKELFGYFNDRIRQTVNKSIKTKQNNKPLLGHWANGSNFSIKWDQASVLQFWGHEDALNNFKDAYPDHQHILSLQDKFYFDCGTGNKYGDSLCDPYETWAKIRMFEPTEYYKEGDTTLLGGEGALWSELATPYNVFNKIWPRLGVITSIFWSPKIEGLYQWDEIVAELVRFRKYLEDNGIPTNKISSR